jgi:hypothetical protein
MKDFWILFHRWAGITSVGVAAIYDGDASVYRVRFGSGGASAVGA